MSEIQWRAGPDLSAAEVYEIWRIRDLVFSVGQRICDVDVDGIDLRNSCTHGWIADEVVGAGQFASYLRVYTDHAGRHIGRVSTREEARGRGLSSTLLRAALTRWGNEPLLIGAQAHLEGWYTGFGFTVTGSLYDDAGIPHLPMVRPAG